MMYPGILEADDVIAFLCKHLTGHKTVVSTDNDMVQLIDDHTQLYSPIKKVTIDVHNCEQHLPVHVGKYLLYKSILGDASDCIKGLPGYGKVKAKRLSENYELEFPKLSAELQQQQLHNMRMMNLNQGLVEHPEERDCYLKQLESLQLQTHYNII